MQKEEYLIKNACYSVTKYYLCKQNNKRSLLGRKQRNQVTRSFPNRYLFSFTNKVTSLFSIRYILIIILHRKTRHITRWNDANHFTLHYQQRQCFQLSLKQPPPFAWLTTPLSLRRGAGGEALFAFYINDICIITPHAYS